MNARPGLNVLNAKDGPLGTSDYRIQLEAIALPNAKTFLHLTYSYGFNFAGRLAMQTYLATLGRDKVGFTPTGKANAGQGGYVGRHARAGGAQRDALLPRNRFFPGVRQHGVGVTI